jgi:hypothetical protein
MAKLSWAKVELNVPAKIKRVNKYFMVSKIGSKDGALKGANLNLVRGFQSGNGV